MIVTEGLGKQFGEFTAVDGISLNLGRGQVLGLLGPNGAGKTTTVRMLSSVLKPSHGRASVAGYDTVRDAASVRGQVGVLTENHGLYNRMPATDYLDFYGRLYRLSPQMRKRRIAELLEHYGLAEHSRKAIGEFSKGMRQKLALARALLHDPPVLLLDEPTSAMDPESARLVRDAIHDLVSNERTIIICTHNLPEAEELADQIAIIRHGRIIQLGTSDELKDRLLGPPEFELRLNQPLNGERLDLPAPAEMTTSGSNWLRFRSPSPTQTNPLVLRYILGQGLEVVSLQAGERNLEQVYLQAVSTARQGENGHG